MAQLIQVDGSKVVKAFGMVGSRLTVVVNGETFGKGKPDVQYVFAKLGRNAFDAMQAAESKGSYFCKNIGHKAEVVSKTVLN